MFLREQFLTYLDTNLDDAQAFDLWAVFIEHKALFHMEGIPM
jgi:hypothetical protein